MADAPDLGSGGEILRGSRPLPGTMSPNPSSFAEYLNHFLEFELFPRPKSFTPCRPFLRGELSRLDILRHKTAQIFCRPIAGPIHGLRLFNPMSGRIWCACAACVGLGFARDTATTFDVFYWLQVTNFDVLLNSAPPDGPDYIDIWVSCLHAASPCPIIS